MKKNSRKKAPAFQFYAADWLTDSSLRMVSAEARGVWIDLLCHAFLSNDPGFLIINGFVLDTFEIQKLSGISQKRFKKVWDELTTFGIVKQDEKGRYFSKRMVQDAQLSRLRAESGSKGGNPKLKNLVNQNKSKTKAKRKQSSTPSSSSSSSTSKEEKIIKKEFHFLINYLEENCPGIQSLKNQLTIENAKTLEEEFGIESTIEIFNRMENFNKLSKYKSAYLTARNWLKKEQNDTNQKKGTKSSFESAVRNF